MTTQTHRNKVINSTLNRLLTYLQMFERELHELEEGTPEPEKKEEIERMRDSLIHSIATSSSVIEALEDSPDKATKDFLECFNQ